MLEGVVGVVREWEEGCGIGGCHGVGCVDGRCRLRLRVGHFWDVEEEVRSVHLLAVEVGACSWRSLGRLD